MLNDVDFLVIHLGLFQKLSSGGWAAILLILHPQEMQKGTNTHPRINRNISCPTLRTRIFLISVTHAVLLHSLFSVKEIMHFV